MTYFGVLVRFIGPPLAVLAAISALDLARGKRVPSQYRTWPAWAILLGHVAIALLYTTPWDNYLVANRVWWYEPSLVTGIVFGWVPIETVALVVAEAYARSTNRVRGSSFCALAVNRDRLLILGGVAHPAARRLAARLVYGTAAGMVSAPCPRPARVWC